MRISDWSSDVCSSDLTAGVEETILQAGVPVLGERRADTRDRLPGEARVRIVDERAGEDRREIDARDTGTPPADALRALVVAEVEPAVDHQAPGYRHAGRRTDAAQQATHHATRESPHSHHTRHPCTP